MGRGGGDGRGGGGGEGRGGGGKGRGGGGGKGERRGGKGRGGGGGGKGRGYPQDGEPWRAEGPRRGGEEAARGQAGPRRPPPRNDGPAAEQGDVPRGLRAAQGLRDPMKPPPPALAPSAGGLLEAKAAAEEPPRRPSPDRADDGGDWAPDVDQRMEKPDRRTFFHTAGKNHTIGQAKTDGKKYGNPQEECEVGSTVMLQVDEVHFGQPRVGLRGEPEMMGKMIKWPADKFDEYTLECAQISFGTDYWVWSTATITSNRILYAMKRAGVRELRAQCVPAPPLPEPDEDVDLTYGASIQGIQLVP